MDIKRLNREQTVLAIGDALALLITVLVGFLSHNSQSNFLARFAYTWIPWTFSWFLAASLLKLFHSPLPNWKSLVWRISIAVLLASPLATMLRAALLHSTAIPLFALIMGLSSALGLLIWRLIYGTWFAKG